MKQLWVAVGMAVFAVACSDTPAELSEGPAFSEGQGKAVLCHDNGTDGYVRIEIADPALQAHIDHGDAGPGELVPGDEEWRFTGACELEEVAVCPCFATPDAVSNLMGEWTPFESIHSVSHSIYGSSYVSWILGGVGPGVGPDTVAVEDYWWEEPPRCYASKYNSRLVTVTGLDFGQVQACHAVLLDYANANGLACQYWWEEPWCDPYTPSPPY